MMTRSSSGPVVWFGIIVVTCLLLVVFQFVLWLIVPIMLAIVANYLLAPLVDMGVGRGMTRSRAVLVVTVLLTVVLALITLMIWPRANAFFHKLPTEVGAYATTANRLVVNARRSLSENVPFLFPSHAAPATNPAEPPPEPTGVTATTVQPAPPVVTKPEEMETSVADLQAKYSGDIAMELLHWIPSLLLVPYITYFFLLDGPRFKRFLVGAIPNAFFEKTLFLFYRVEDQLKRYFQGLLALTALDALCLGIGFWFLGLNYPFLFAILAAAMAWLPYLGSIAGGLLVMLVAATDFPDTAHAWLPYEVLGVFIGVRLLDDFVFLPLTVGRSLQMHPLVTVLMILLGGAVAGIGGLLLVMPVLGVVMVAGQIVGELVTDKRILARHRHAQRIMRLRARADLFEE